jgi:hypothetical protein
MPEVCVPALVSDIEVAPVGAPSVPLSNCPESSPDPLHANINRAAAHTVLFRITVTVDAIEGARARVRDSGPRCASTWGVRATIAPWMPELGREDTLC